MGKGTNTTTSQSAPNPAAATAYYDLLNRSANVAQTPYQAYSGNLTAPINAQQNLGIANINQGAGFASPYIQEAAGFARGAAQPLTAAQIQQYQSPYTQQVVDATSNWLNNQNQQQQQNVIGNAAASNALGGDRVGIARANLASQQTASQAPIIAGLYNQGYTQALGVAQQQQQNQANAAYSIGNLGVSGQNAALTGANAQVGAGNLEQQNEQQRLNALYQQYQIAQAFPYQQTQWLAGVQTGVGSQLGGTSSTTAPAPNPWAQYAGVGLTAASMFLNRGGRIRGFAPGGTVSDAPFAGVGWIPTRGITMGRGAPPAPSVPQQQAAQFKPMDFKGRFGSDGSAGMPLDITSEGGGFSPGGVGATYGFGSSPAMGGLGPIYRDGGGVRSESTEYEIARRAADRAARPMSGVGRMVWPEEAAFRDAARRPFERAMEAAGPYHNGGGVHGYADGGSPTFETALSPQEEARFQDWKSRMAPNDSGHDYDLRGAFQSGAMPAQNGHWPDTYKKPNHPTFSVESNYAIQRPDLAGIWDGERYIPASQRGDLIRGFALGGVPEFLPDYNPDAQFPPIRAEPDMLPPMARAALSRGVAADAPTDFAGRWAPVPEAVAAGTAGGGFDPQGANNGNFDARPTVSDAGLVPMPRERPAEAPQAAVADDDTLPPTAAPVAGFAPQPDGMAAGPSPTAGGVAPPAETSRRGFNLGLIPDNLRMPLMTAGLAMLASRSPNLGNAIGEGGLAGVGAYTSQEQAKLQHAEKQQALSTTSRHIDNETKRLDQAAERARQALAETTRHHGEVERRAAEEATFKQMQPITIGTTASGLEIKAVRDPASGSYRIIDPSTGKLLQPGETLPGAKPPGAYIDPGSGKPIAQGTEANADGVIPANAQLVSSSVPYDYSTDAPYIEKGMDVPKPGPVSGKSPRAVETDSEYYLQTGKLPPVARGKSPVAIQQNNYRNAVQNYSGALAQSRGLSPEQTAEMWRTAPGMLRFILGADGRSTVALGTAVRHLDTVQELAKAWAANDTQGINRLRAIISRQFGSEAATNLEAAGQIVGPEIIKALGVAGAGTEHDRQTAAAQFSTARSPAQLKGAVDTVQKLLGGQLEGRKRQASNAGVSEERFKSLVGERSYEILSNIEKKTAPVDTVRQNGHTYKRQPDGSYKAID